MLQKHHFGITIELEDFINVRTVEDIRAKDSEVIARQKGTSLPPAAKVVNFVFCNPQTNSLPCHRRNI